MKRSTALKRRTPLAAHGKSDTALLKEEIQALLRQIVIHRDGGCILRKHRFCGGEVGTAVLQADHLITRANSATYADHRLVVCLCRPCHGWKHWHKEEYDALVKSILEPERVALWEACERDSWKPHRMTTYDWAKEATYLRSKLDGEHIMQ